MNIITGFKGEAHISSADVQAFQSGIAGTGILPTGQGLNCTAGATANQVYIYDGDAVMQGVHFRVEPGQYDVVTIASGQEGVSRCDIIAARYEKDESTGVESMTWRVITGSYSSSTPEPDLSSLVQGDIRGGDLVAEEAFAYVYIDGLSISGIEMCYDVLPNLSGLINAQQMALNASGKYVINGAPQVLSVTIPTINARTQGSKITASAAGKINSGSDAFFAIPIDGGYFITNGFSFSVSGQTVSFWPINIGSSSMSGAFRCLIVSLKEI